MPGAVLLGTWRAEGAPMAQEPAGRWEIS